MWELRYAGHVVRWDDLTLTEVEAIEQAAGAVWPKISPTRCARHAMAIARVSLARFGLSAEAGQVRVRDWKLAVDDLPDLFVDEVPSNPRREGDRWIVQLCPPFTPRQVREEFTLRDLYLLATAKGKRSRV